MPITTAICASFKRELLEGKHDFRTTGHTFKIALYTSAATLNALTTDYTTSNEVTGTGYVAGGQTLTNVNPTLYSVTAITDFADEVFPAVTITARGALIYNTTTGGGSGTTNAVVVLDFGTDKSATAGDFTIQFPAPAAETAIIRIV